MADKEILPEEECALEHIAVIIPSYEPDERLVVLIQNLQKLCQNIVVVNDGSNSRFDGIFRELENRGVTVLRHAVNQGKGRALKTAFNYCLLQDQELIGCVTADSDGQHLPEDIIRCGQTLQRNPGDLVLGCRNFDDDSVPQKSRYGNKITRTIFRYLCGLKITDTQTGLRGIPAKFMRELLSVPGERFEFETNMLIAAKDGYSIREIEIKTVYDSKTNHQTHFDPLKDSIRIYRILGRIFLSFIISSLSASIIDLSLFAIFCALLREKAGYILLATALARIISATYNYLVNYHIVFSSKEQHCKSTVKYIVLAIVQGTMSAILVNALVLLVGARFELLAKIVVDTLLFVLSFYIQREFVFQKKGKN